MATTGLTIELDADTAELLGRQAADRGVTVSEFVTALVRRGEDVDEDKDADAIAELDRRWAKIEQGEPTVSHDKVVRWLETWGTPDFKPWQSDR